MRKTEKLLNHIVLNDRTSFRQDEPTVLNRNGSILIKGGQLSKATFVSATKEIENSSNRISMQQQPLNMLRRYEYLEIVLDQSFCTR